ncbi:MAG: TRM11 family SAM-dependent methyltransferase [Nanoarchaeota archaeon]
MLKKYLFILGRNPHLSLEEVKSYFKRTSRQVLKTELASHCLYIEVSDEIKEKEINNFGGVISIAEVLTSGNISEIKNNLEKISIYSGKKDKMNYVLWNFADEENYFEILSYLKSRFKLEKLKATHKPLSEKMLLQSGETVRVFSSNKLIDEEFCLFKNSRNFFYFGKVFQKIDYKSLEERDMNKPVRRSELSISPRLGKILINLSEVKKGDKLLDPFCGIGVILQEALLQDIRVLGIDLDKKAIQGAINNLEWQKFSNKNYELLNKDSRNFKLNSKQRNNLKAIATEPSLGKILKKLPTKKEAEENISYFENLIINVINNFKNNIQGKIVFTCPIIKTAHKRISVDFSKISLNTGLKIKKGFPISEYRKNQIVGREICVLESVSKN